MAFENLTLMPFCLEKSSVGKGIFQCFTDIFSVILVGIR